MIFIINNPEIIAFCLNISMTAIFFVKQDYAKVTYWLGATLLTAGLMQMKGKV